MAVFALSKEQFVGRSIGGTRRAAMLMSAQESKDGSDLSGDSWRVTMQELNAAPVFAVTFAEGRMLQNGQERVLFFIMIVILCCWWCPKRGRVPEGPTAALGRSAGTGVCATMWRCRIWRRICH